MGATTAALLVAVLCAAPASFGHAGHAHGLVYGPPAPEFAFEGDEAEQSRAAAAARDERGRQAFALELAAAPLERGGRCDSTAEFDGIGEGCRTRDGLLRVELPGGDSMTTHGPDFAESMLDADAATQTTRMVAAIRHASKDDVHCVPATERHTRLVYAIPADGVDRSATMVPKLRRSAYEMSAVVDNESRSLSPAAGRRVRFLCDASGEPVVDVYRLSSTTAQANDFSVVTRDLHAAAGTSNGVGTVRYLMFYDAHLGGFSGIGLLYNDDQPGAANSNNSGGMVALQDSSSGEGPNWYVLLHEASHNMGAVQDSAPDTTTASHCRDGLDVMCYGDGGLSYDAGVCALTQYDCDHDTYFHPAPAGGSHLATKWNVASTNNGYLQAWTAPIDTTPPTQPSNLQAAGGGSFVRLTWDASSDAGSGVSAYRVYRLDGAVWRIVDDAWPGDEFLDASWSGITSNTTYALKVTAYDRRGNESAATQISASSGTAGLTRTVSGTIDAPSDVRITANAATSITLDWEPVDGATTRYRVRRRVSPAGGWVTWWTTGNDLTVTGLTAGTLYDFSVLAYDLSGRESAATALSGWTTGGTDGTAPSPPTNVQVASSAGNTPTVTWTAAATATTYVVSTETSPGVWTTVGTTAGTSFAVTGIPYGVTRTIGVSAVDNALNASARATTTFTTGAQPDQTRPGDATVTSTSRTMTSLTASWSAATDNVGVVGYRMYVARDDTGQYSLGASTNGALTATATGLTPGTLYRVRIIAVDAAGYSSSSLTYWYVTTLSDTTDPSNVGGFAASGQTETSVNLSWNAATDNAGIAGYRVYRQEPDTSWTQLAQVTGTSHTVTGLAATTSYTFGVRAIDVAGRLSPTTTSLTTSTTGGVPDTQAPSAPTNVTAPTIAATSVGLAWTAATDDVGVANVRIYRVSPNPSGTPVATLGGAATSATIGSLASQTQYTFELEARDAAGNDSARASITVTTLDVTAPTQPTGFAATDRQATSITMGWNASSDSAGGGVQYKLYRLVGGVWTLQATTAATSWQATSLASSTSYTFAVASIDGSGNESAKTQLATSTLDVTAPTQPGAITPGTITGTSIALAWGASSDDVSLAGYRVYRQSPNASGTPVASPIGTSTTITGLVSGVSYTFAVRAVDASGNESAARTITVTTQDVVAPSQPGGVAASALGETSVRVSWGASSDNVAVTGYRVLRVVGGVASEVATTTSLQFDVTGLTAATAYRFQVESYDAAGNASTRGTVDIVTPDASAPSQPANGVVSSRSDTAIALAWGAASDNVGVTGYRIWRTAPTASGVTIGTTAGATTFTVTGLVADTDYEFEVAAIDAAGNESAHATISGRTDSQPDTIAPTQPGSLAASNLTTTSARLTWDASSDAGGIATYRVERLDGSWTIVATTSATSRDLAALAPASTYTYRVSAIDAAGNVSTPASISFTTPAPADLTAPGAPGGPLQLSATASGVVGLSWGAAGDDVAVAQYRIFRLSGSTWSQVATSTGTSSSLADQPVGGVVQYAVAAVDGAGNEGARLTGSVLVPSPLRAAPDAPAWVSATPSTTGVVLRWALPADATTVTSWTVTAIRAGTVLSTRTLDMATSSYTGFLPKTALTFTVVANGPNGSSGAASVATATLADTVKPTRPRLLRAAPLTRQRMAIAWTASADRFGIARYEVRLNAVGVRARVIRVGRLVRSVTATRLVRGRTYTVSVRAVDRYGNASAWSGVLRARAR